jgi:hypothetical protein
MTYPTLLHITFLIIKPNFAAGWVTTGSYSVGLGFKSRARRLGTQTEAFIYSSDTPKQWPDSTSIQPQPFHSVQPSIHYLPLMRQLCVPAREHSLTHTHTYIHTNFSQHCYTNSKKLYKKNHHQHTSLPLLCVFHILSIFRVASAFLHLSLRSIRTKIPSKETNKRTRRQEKINKQKESVSFSALRWNRFI